MVDPGTPTDTRKLVRLPDDGHIAGVCAGLARFLNVDPFLVRIAAFILLLTGPGFFIYLAAWIFIPAVDGSMLVDSVKPIPEDRHTQVVGIVLIATAIIVFSGGFWWSPSRHWVIPLGLVGLGAWLLLRKDRDDGRPDPAVPPPAGPSSTPWAWPTTPDPTSVVPAPPAPAGTAEAPTAPPDPTETDVTTQTETEPDAPADATSSVFAAPLAGGGGDGPPSGDAPTMSMPVPPVPPVPPAPRRRRFLGPLVFGALLIWGGAAWLGGIDLNDGLAIALVILGGGFVLGAVVGGSRVLVFPAFLIGAALVFTSVVDIPWEGGIGDRRWEVDDLSDLNGDYELGIGHATLDLEDLDVPDGRHRTVHASVGLGELTVIVPDGVSLEITGHVGAGDIDLLGRHDDGMSVDLDREVDGSSTRGTLELDLEVGLGHIEVLRD